MKKILISLLFFFSLAFSVSPAFAVTVNGIRPQAINSRCTYHFIGKDDSGKVVQNDRVLTLDCIPLYFVRLVYFALLFAGVVALFLIVFAGIKFITSGGDPKQLEGARKTLMWALIGLVVIFMSFAIVRLVADVTGVDCLTQFGFSQCKK